MEVYIVLSHCFSDYPNTNTIESVCLTEDIAKQKVADFEKFQANFITKTEYWYEDFDLDIGNLKVLQNYENNSVVLG